MLRGQASLQELIGRSFITRKRSGSKPKKQQPADAAQDSSSAATKQNKPIPSPDQPQQQQQQQQQVLQPGQVFCPVCNGAVLEQKMNTHLDTCLAKETLQRSRGDAKQSTLGFQQASRPSSAAPSSTAPSKPPAPAKNLQRSATASAASKAMQGAKANTRRASSDSALLLAEHPNTCSEQETAAASPTQAQDSNVDSLPVRAWRARTPPASPSSTVQNNSSPFKAKSQLQREDSSSVEATALDNSTAFKADGSVHVCTSIVGRRFRTGVMCTKQTPVSLSRQFDNPRDPNAIQVLESRSQQVIGYLPRDIARHLASLLDDNLVAVAASADEPKSVAAVVPIVLNVVPVQSTDTDQPGLQNRLEHLVRSAAEWQANGLKRQGSGTGTCLRTNMLLMADTVVQQDAHLLEAAEKELLLAFKELPDEAQCLFLRLFLRKGPWFRLNTLAYSELTDVSSAAELLSAEQMACCTNTQARECSQQLLCELSEALTVAELQQLVSGLELGPQGRAANSSKGQMLQWLKAGLEKVEGAAQEGTMKQEVLNVVGPCMRLTDPPCNVIRRVQRLFFLNEAQSLSSFLVADLGVAKYPTYRATRSRSVFSQRQDLLDYEEALLHAAELDNALEDSDTDAAERALQPAFAAISAGLHKQPPSACHGDCSVTQLPFFLRYSAAWVYAAMATTGVSLLEKAKQWQKAVDLLQQLLGGVCCLKRRGEWWTRLSLDLEHLGRPDESLEMAEAALADEWVMNGDRIAVQRRVLRLGKPPRRWKRPSWAAVAMREPLEVRIEGQPLSSLLGIKSRFIGNGGEECSVEELALQYYAAEDRGAWTGTHAEGGIWATLFGLLMWDVLFMDVPDVFQTAFQTAPLDLGTVVFYPTRQEAIETRLTQIRGGEAIRLLQHCWQQHLGEWCRGVNWDRHSLDELVSISECVGGRGLAAICKLLAQDFSGWAGGMPDLLLWNVHTCRAKLSEVKGPRDRLSDQQRAWINALIDAEVDVEVLKVVEPRQGNAPKRRRKW